MCRWLAFRHGRWLFTHNDDLADFAKVKRDLVNELPESSYGVVGRGEDALGPFWVTPPAKTVAVGA